MRRRDPPMRSDGACDTSLRRPGFDTRVSLAYHRDHVGCRRGVVRPLGAAHGPAKGTDTRDSVIHCESGRVPYLRFANIDDLVAHHAVFTRHGGTSRGPFASLNVGYTVGDSADCVEANHALVYQVLGVTRDCVVTAEQVHGTRIGVVTSRDGGRVMERTDALVTDEPGVYLMLRFADCVPVLMYAPDRRMVALVHTGWRGAAQRIVGSTVEMMVRHFECDPAEMRVGIGPSIGQCCYEVGTEVSQAMQAVNEHSPGVVTRRDDRGKAHVDLQVANADQLAALGVRHVEIAGVCTRCHRDDFYSHRGDNGRTGRFAAVIGLRPYDGEGASSNTVYNHR